LLLIGDGDLKNEIIRQIKQNAILEENTELIDRFLDSKSLLKELSRARISVLPSECYENAPLSILESINCNVIPIACNHGGMKEMIDYFNVGRTFKSDSYKDLGNCLYDVLQNIEREELRLRDSIKLVNEQNQNNYTNQIVDIYCKK
jgi:Glycosyltransferase